MADTALSAADTQLASSPFRSFVMGGFEGATHRRPCGTQVDSIGSTRHDILAATDYRLLRNAGIWTVRDALRWHLIDQDGTYDWSSFRPMLAAARDIGVQIIWDLCHYGVPVDLDIWSPDFVDRFRAFAAAAAILVRDEGGEVPPLYCPMNEISFWAWAGGDVGFLYPSAHGQGSALKAQLVRAALAATQVIQSIDPRARFIMAEPLIHVGAHTTDPAEIHLHAAGHIEAQFEACDMLAGRREPELGGSDAMLDIVGLNFYPENQQFQTGGTIPFGYFMYRPLRELLAEVHARYARPIFIAETGAEGANAAAWLAYVGAEVRAARLAGVPVLGLCLYPVLDYPGWDDQRHCPCGLLSADPDWQGRAVRADVLAQVQHEAALLP